MMDNGEAPECVANDAQVGLINDNYVGANIVISLMTILSDCKWIVDTSDTNHTVLNNHMLSKSKYISDPPNNKLHLPIREQVCVKTFGDASVFSNMTVKDVLHMPEFK